MEHLGIILTTIICFFVVYASAFATYHVSKSELFDPGQRYVIYAIAWLVPVIGPVFIISTVWSEIKERKKSPIPLLGYIFLAAVLSENETTSCSSDNTINNEDTGGEGNGDY